MYTIVSKMANRRTMKNECKPCYHSEQRTINRTPPLSPPIVTSCSSCQITVRKYVPPFEKKSEYILIKPIWFCAVNTTVLLTRKEAPRSSDFYSRARFLDLCVRVWFRNFSPRAECVMPSPCSSLLTSFFSSFKLLQKF